MRQFNAPPGWPDPPNARWRPPKDWGPSEAWPPAPDGWRFWVDENGRPVRGPLGRYGGPSIVKLAVAAAVVVALFGLVLFNPFTGDDSSPTAGSAATTKTTPADGTTSDPGATTSPNPTEPPATGPTDEPTSEPSSTPGTTPSDSPTPTPSTTGPSSPEPKSAPATSPTTTGPTGAVVYRSCAEVRAAGKAPLYRGQPGYSAELDRNGDGIACDRGNS